MVEYEQFLVESKYLNREIKIYIYLPKTICWNERFTDIVDFLFS
jgi:hypothetical protein